MAKVVVNCCACGREFQKFPKDARRGKYHFCSKECLYTPCIPVTCQECGRDFLARGSVRGEIKFCSDECRNARNRREQTYKKSPTITLTCERCGKSFDVRRSVGKVQRYCSQQCSGAAVGERAQGENNVKWKPKVNVTCDYCGKSFDTFPSRVGRRKYCCKDHSVLGNLQRIASGARTNLEIEMADALSRCGIAFDEQVVMFNKFMVDFKLREHAIIVQCDGAYWHARPQVIPRDRGQDRYLAQAGYVVIRFSDKEILEHIDSCLSRIKSAIKTGQMPLVNW